MAKTARLDKFVANLAKELGYTVWKSTSGGDEWWCYKNDKLRTNDGGSGAVSGDSAAAALDRAYHIYNEDEPSITTTRRTPGSGKERANRSLAPVAAMRKSHQAITKNGDGQRRSRTGVQSAIRRRVLTDPTLDPKAVYDAIIKSGYTTTAQSVAALRLNTLNTINVLKEFPPRERLEILQRLEVLPSQEHDEGSNAIREGRVSVLQRDYPVCGS